MNRTVPQTSAAKGTEKMASPVSRYGGRRPFALQTKLSVGAPGDRFEQEADRVAERVMRMPASDGDRDLHTPPAPPRIQRLCKECEEELQKIPMGREDKQQNRGLSDQTQDQIQNRRGGGEDLPSASRAFFEPRFGHDFSQVRVHHDNRANGLAQSLDAQAFTTGRDIFFRSGRFSPQTAAGRHLLAHELTHVIQQGHATARGNDAGSAPSVQRMSSDDVIQRFCVANLIPQLRCCNYVNPVMPHNRIGEIAHEQLEDAAALAAPGVLGEVFIPGIFGTGCSQMDLFRPHGPSPRIPNPAGCASPRPMRNPARLPFTNAPPAPAPALAEVGEIKPLSTYGVASGPVDLASHIAHYKIWHLSQTGILGGMPGVPMVSLPPLLHGGPFFHPAQHIFMNMSVPGLFTYFCIDPKRLLREIRALARRLVQEARRLVQEVHRVLAEILDWLAEWWWVIALIVIAIVLIIVLIFTAKIWVPALATAAAAILAAFGTAEGGAMVTAAAALLLTLIPELLHPDGEPLAPAEFYEGEPGASIPGGAMPTQVQGTEGNTIAALTGVERVMAGLRGGLGSPGPLGIPLESSGALAGVPALLEAVAPVIAQDPRFGDTAGSLVEIAALGRQAFANMWREAPEEGTPLA